MRLLVAIALFAMGSASAATFVMGPVTCASVAGRDVTPTLALIGAGCGKSAVAPVSDKGAGASCVMRRGSIYDAAGVFSGASQCVVDRIFRNQFQ